MDIKKIIKEEMDDFDFVKDTDPNNIFKNIFDSNPNTTYIGIDDELTKDEAEKILSLLNKMGYHSQLKKPLTDWSRGYTLWVTRNSDSIVMGHRRADYDPSNGDMLVPNIFKDVINESDDFGWADEIDVLTTKMSFEDMITLLNRVFDGSDDYYLKANPYSGLSIYDMGNGLMDSFNKHDYEDGISINDITNELTRFGDHVPKLVQKEYTELADMIINHTKQKMTEGG